LKYADMYGPSIPTMLGVKGAQPISADGKLMLLIEAQGIVCNSIGFSDRRRWNNLVWPGT